MGCQATEQSMHAGRNVPHICEQSEGEQEGEGGQPNPRWCLAEARRRRQAGGSSLAAD